jgi:hypothetical protein
MKEALAVCRGAKAAEGADMGKAWWEALAATPGHAETLRGRAAANRRMAKEMVALKAGGASIAEISHG